MNFGALIVSTYRIDFKNICAYQLSRNQDPVLFFGGNNLTLPDSRRPQSQKQSVYRIFHSTPTTAPLSLRRKVILLFKKMPDDFCLWRLTCRCFLGFFVVVVVVVFFVE